MAQSNAVRTEVSRGELQQIVDRVLGSVVNRPGALKPRRVQCLGVELLHGSLAAGRSALINEKLPPSIKPDLEELNRGLRGERGAAQTLAANGYVHVDLRAEGKRPDSIDRVIRHYYVQESLDSFTRAAMKRAFCLRVWAFSSHESPTPFSPLVVRETMDRLTGAVCAAMSDPSRDVFAFAVRRGAVADALKVLTEMMGAAATAMWSYDDTTRMLTTIATHNIGSRPLAVPATKLLEEKNKGIVSLARPDRVPVIYDKDNSELWRPKQGDAWQPFDIGLFERRKWRSSIAVPVVCVGKLVGAVTAYSERSAALFWEVESDLIDYAALSADAILAVREDTVVAAQTEKYDEELLTANISLAALSLSHDVLHYFRGVGEFIREGIEYLSVGQTKDAAAQLNQAVKTMDRTGPAIGAMRRLAKEARATDTEDREARIANIDAVLGEIQSFLQSILPLFSRSRLKPQNIVVDREGTPRVIAISPATFERIIVNLCVNSAQWSARHISVIASFDRSDHDVHIVVRDDGSGISVAARERVFDRFFSGRGGSGLGLYVVKRLVDKVAGEVFVQPLDDESLRQQGTVITVVLPTESVASQSGPVSRPTGESVVR
jgi:signal transduction histidine kinase